MSISLPKTPGGWISFATIAVLVLLFLYFFTPVMRGHAVEISVENDGSSDIFAAIDNTGRHGDETNVERIHTDTGDLTPPGIRINKGLLKSFGMAVGLGDSPTLHVWLVSDQGTADSNRVSDCPFDTVNWAKLQLPSIHVKLKWTGQRCIVEGQ